MITVYGTNEFDEPLKFVITDELQNRVNTILESLIEVYLEPNENIEVNIFSIVDSFHPHNPPHDIKGQLFVCKNSKSEWMTIKVMGWGGYKRIGNDLLDYEDVFFSEEFIKYCKTNPTKFATSIELEHIKPLSQRMDNIKL
jgi:hypothetical protein